MGWEAWGGAPPAAAAWRAAMRDTGMLPKGGTAGGSMLRAVAEEAVEVDRSACAAAWGAFSCWNCWDSSGAASSPAGPSQLHSSNTSWGGGSGAAAGSARGAPCKA